MIGREGTAAFPEAGLGNGGQFRDIDNIGFTVNIHRDMQAVDMWAMVLARTTGATSRVLRTSCHASA